MKNPRPEETDGTTGDITTYGYDGAGRLIQVTDVSGTFTYEYNLANQFIRMTGVYGIVKLH